MIDDGEIDVRQWRPDPGRAPGFSPARIGALVVVAGCVVIAYLFLPFDRWFSGVWAGFGTASEPPSTMASLTREDDALSKLAQHYVPKAPERPLLATVAPEPVAEETSVLETLTAQYAQLQGQYAQLMEAFNQIKGQAAPAVSTPKANGMSDEAKQQAAESKRKREAFAKSEPIFLTREKKEGVGQLHALKSPYSLAPSEVIPCETSMALSSETPGAFVAIVRQDVPDTATRTKNVIPKGSKFVLKPRGRLIFGDSRIDIQTQTLTFPGGAWLKMPAHTVTDAYGTAGFTGRIDRHYLRIFGSILITGVLRGGTTVALNGYDGGVGERIGGAVIQEGASAGTQQVQRQMSRTDPTITVETLYACQILLEDELVLTRAYPWTP